MHLRARQPAGPPAGGEIRFMPEKKMLQRARKDKQEGKAPTTQAGEFVHEEMDHIRRGKHGARSTKQAIAIGLSKARRAGVQLKPPAKGKSSAATRKKAESDLKRGKKPAAAKKTSTKRSQATKKALKREGRSAASHKALSKQARSAAKRRGAGTTTKRTSKTASRKSTAKKSQRARSG
jgi:hypothetical protein